MTAPERPELDVEAIKRVIDFGLTGPCPEWPDCTDGEGPCYACAQWEAADERSRAVLSQLPAILAALEEREGLLRVHAVAGDAVDALLDLGACPDPLCTEPNCHHVLPRLVAALAAIPAREAEEIERGR